MTISNRAEPVTVYGLGYYEHYVTGAFYVFACTLGHKAKPAMTDAGPFDTAEAAMVEMGKYDILMSMQGIPHIKLGNAPKMAAPMRGPRVNDE